MKKAWQQWLIGLAIAIPSILMIGFWYGPETDDYDVRNGAIRKQYRCLGIVIRTSISNDHTDLSPLGNPCNRGLADWRRVNTFYWRAGYSPHYAYHGAIHAEKTLERLLSFSYAQFDDEVRTRLVDHYRYLLRVNAYDEEARAFVKRIGMALRDDSMDENAARIEAILSAEYALYSEGPCYQR